MSQNSFDAKSSLSVGDRSYEIFRLDALGLRPYRLRGSFVSLLLWRAAA